MKVITIHNPDKYWNIHIKGIEQQTVPKMVKILNDFSGFYWHSYDDSSLHFRYDAEVPDVLRMEVPDKAFALVSIRVDDTINLKDVKP